MICFRILYLTSLLLFGINISLWGYEKRELLQKEVTLDELKSTLVTEQKWVIYPPYSDRKQWNALLGDYKDHLIRQGEQFLKYNWQVIFLLMNVSAAVTGCRDLIIKIIWPFLP